MRYGAEAGAKLKGIALATGGQVLPALLFILSVFAATSNAHAHATLTATEPPDGAQLTAAPDSIVLRFTEPVMPVAVRLLDASGQTVAEIAGLERSVSTVILPLHSRIPDGLYVVTYRVMSADTHPITGASIFSVGSATLSGGAVHHAPDIESPDQSLLLATRFLTFVALLVASGTLFFTAFNDPPTYLRPKLARLVNVAAVTGGAMYVMAIGIGGADIVGLGGAGIFEKQSWQVGAGSTLLESAAVGTSGLVFLFFGRLAKSSAGGNRLLVIAGVVLLSGLAFTGHAATVGPRWIMGPVVAIHLFVAAFWLAALLPLAWILRESTIVESTQVLGRFSRLAPIAVALLIASGAYMTYIQVQSLSAIFSTDYGTTLALKLGIVLLLLALAAVNRFRLTKSIASGQIASVRRLRISIFVEIAAITMILALTTLLTVTVPPRSLSTSQTLPVNATAGNTEPLVEYQNTATQQDYVLHVSVLLESGRGRHLQATVATVSGTPFTPVRVDARLDLPDFEVSGVNLEWTVIDGNVYTADMGRIQIPGAWDLRVDVLVDDFTQLTYRMTIPVSR